MIIGLARGLRVGASFGVLIIFLVLIGFPTTLVTVILPKAGFAEAADAGSATQRLTLLILFGLVGAWAGAAGTRSRASNSSWFGELVSSLTSGVVSGLMLVLMILLLGALRDADFPIHDHLVQMRRPAIVALLFGEPALSAALTYWGTLVVASLVGYGLSLIIRLVRVPLSFLRRKIAESRPRPGSPGVRQAAVRRYAGYALLVIIMLALPQAMEYLNWTQQMGTVGIYILLGLGLNIVVGLAGLLDLGYVAFFAVGAYTMGLLTAPEPLAIGWSFWPALIAGLLCAAITGVLLGLPVLRMRGDYLAIVTLGFGEIISALIPSEALTSFTGGPQGIRPVARPLFIGVGTGYKEFLYLIILGALLVIFITSRLQNSRVGRAWVAMREDETVAQAVGINTLRYKLLAFGIGAAFAGLGGALFASRQLSLSPGNFQLQISIDVLSLVIVGGMGSIPGVMLGAFALRGLPELLRDLENYRVLAFGGLLVAMMIFRPEGIWPSHRRRLEMQEAWDEPDRAAT